MYFFIIMSAYNRKPGIHIRFIFEEKPKINPLFLIVFDGLYLFDI